MDLTAFDLTGIRSFTRFWSLLIFGCYSVINIIVLLNMLIAMMSNSYQIISVSEFKHLSEIFGSILHLEMRSGNANLSKGYFDLFSVYLFATFMAPPLSPS